MNIHMPCAFCNFKSKGQLIGEYDFWTLITCNRQPVLGWTIAILNRHVQFFEELTSDELSELKTIITKIKASINKSFKPDWFNVMQLGNADKHLHFHLVPRYKKPREFAGKKFTDKNYGGPVQDAKRQEDNVFIIMLTNYLKKNLPN
jgi:diadenosine tetraphosphate (Ap4A) HIT family hydrolase